MSVVEKLKSSWIYAIAMTVISTSAITWTVAQSLVVAPAKEELKRQVERVKYLEGVLGNVKAQYDIPDSVISDLGRVAGADAQGESSDADMPDILEPEDWDAPVKTTIKRSRVAQIRYRDFRLSISVADVDHDGSTAFNVSYVLPFTEVPESLQFALYPGQTMTVVSSDDKKLIYMTLMTSEPLKKTAVVEVMPLQDLRSMLIEQGP